MSHALLLKQPVTVHQVMPFLDKTTFFPVAINNVCLFCHVIQSDMLGVCHSPTQLFLSIVLSFPAQCQLQRPSQLQEGPVPCNFLLLMGFSLLMLHPIIWPFIFSVWGFQYPVVSPNPLLCARFIMPCKKSRLLHSCCIKWPFSCPIGSLPYIWIKWLLKLIFVIKVVQLIFFFADYPMTFWIWPKYGITVIPAYIHTHLNV